MWVEQERRVFSDPIKHQEFLAASSIGMVALCVYTFIDCSAIIICAMIVLAGDSGYDHVQDLQKLAALQILLVSQQLHFQHNSIHLLFS
jgi:hypothetical protein